MKSERSCYNCGNFSEGYFCSYIHSYCEIYGILDYTDRHPDTAGAMCTEHKPGEPKLYKPTPEKPPKMINGLTEAEFIKLLDEMDKNSKGGTGNAI